MANNYYDATGVLVFAGQAKITPVIRALFGAFNLDETYPGENKAYIAQMSEETNAHWDSVAEHIVNQQKALGIALPEDADEDLITKWLYALGDRFGAKSDSFINMIENYDFDCDVSLDTLFELAMSFNDGHNLVAIEFEGCWRCSKPRLFEFGGNSQYISKEVQIDIDSTQGIVLGRSLRDAIAASNLDEIGVLAGAAVKRLLDGIRDVEVRQSAAVAIVAQLQSQS
jgi:hypothetical protein